MCFVLSVKPINVSMIVRLNIGCSRPEFALVPDLRVVKHRIEICLNAITTNLTAGS